MGELDRTGDLCEVGGIVTGVRDDPVRGDADRQLAAAALLSSLERREPELVERHVDDAGHAGGEVRLDGALHLLVPVRVGGRRIAVRPRELGGRRLVEHPGRLALRIPSDLSPQRIRSVPRDAELRQGRAVDPARVVVVRIEIYRNVRDGRIDHRRCRGAAGNRIEEPSPSAEHGRLRILGAGAPQERLDLFQTAGICELHLRQGGAHHQKVGVRVGETRQHQPAPEVDRRVRARRAIRAPDVGEGVAVDHERLGPCLRGIGIGVGGEDAAVDEKGGHGRPLFPGRMRCKPA